MTFHSNSNNELEIDEDAILEYIELNRQLEYVQEKIKNFKDKVREKVDSGEKKTIDTELIKVSIGKDTTSTTVDLTSIKKNDTELYEKLLDEYPKENIRKGALRITIKEK